MGTYEIQETKTLDGLVLNRNKYEVKFTQKDLVTKVYDEKLDFFNDTTLVEFSKTDVTGDKELVGAKLQVIDTDGNVVDEWTSTEITHKIEGLTIGKEYTLKEEIDLKLKISRLYRKIKKILKDRERTIIELRFGLNGKSPKTQHDIAKSLGISRSYVSRIETKAISKLAKEIRE